MIVVLNFLHFILSNLEEFDKFVDLFNIFRNVSLQFFKTLFTYIRFIFYFV